MPPDPSREHIAAVKAMLQAQDHAAAEIWQALIAERPDDPALRHGHAEVPRCRPACAASRPRQTDFAPCRSAAAPGLRSPGGPGGRPPP